MEAAKFYKVLDLLGVDYHGTALCCVLRLPIDDSEGPFLCGEVHRDEGKAPERPRSQYSGVLDLSVS